MLPYTNERKRTKSSRRKPGPLWKRPGIWFRFIIAVFTINLFVAIVTVERHISSSVTTIKSSSLEMDRPRMTPLSTGWRSQSGQEQGTFSTESRIWHRMLLQKERTNQKSFCNNQAENRTMVAELYDGVAQLPPLGFTKSVQAYVREHENTSSTSNDGVSMSSTYCLAPPSKPSCQSTQYTVVIYSSGHVRNEAESTDKDTKQNNYWRNIVVGTMKYLAYPSVKRVNLILRDENSLVHNRKSSLEDSAKQNKYARRILNWKQKGDANVVMVSTLWDAIDRLEVPSESVLWIDGDYSVRSLRKISNDTELNEHFHAWREVPNALELAEETSLVSLSLKGSDENCSFPLLHEMMMHANYLCYLNHPVVGSELRNFINALTEQITPNSNTNKEYGIDKSSWDITTIAMGMLLFSVGDGYIVKGVDPSSTAAMESTSNFSLLPHSTASDITALATYMEDISNYFGCPCSTAIPRLSLPITRQCSSWLATSLA